MSGSSRSVSRQSFSDVRRLETEKMPKNRNANFLSFLVRSVRYSVRFDRYRVRGLWWTALADMKQVDHLQRVWRIKGVARSSLKLGPKFRSASYRHASTFFRTRWGLGGAQPPQLSSYGRDERTKNYLGVRSAISNKIFRFNLFRTAICPTDGTTVRPVRPSVRLSVCPSIVFHFRLWELQPMKLNNVEGMQKF